MDQPRETPWSLSANERFAFAWAVGLSVLARGGALLLGWSADDLFWLGEHQDLAAYEYTFVTNGRFAHGLLALAMRQLGVSAPHGAPLLPAAAIVLMAWAGVMVARFWGATERRWAGAAVAAMFCLHPFHAELFTFRITTFYAALAYAGAALLLVHRAPTVRQAVAVAVPFILALGLYQAVLSSVATVLLLGLVAEVARRGSISGLRPYLRTSMAPRIAAVGAATVAYFAIVRVLVHAYGFDPGRGTLLPAAQLPARLQAVLALDAALFLEDEPLLPIAVKGLLLVLLILALVALGLRLRRSPESGRGRWAAGLAAAGILLLAALTLPGLVVVIREWWPTPRVLAQASVFWAGIALLALAAQEAWLRRTAAAVVVVVIASFVGIGDRVLTDQLRQNARDRDLASRILGRLEATRGFSGVSTLAIVGARGFPLPLRTRYMDLNISAFETSWSNVALIEEVAGIRLRAPDEMGMLRARLMCASAPRWPEVGSVAIAEALAVVCL